MKRDNPLPFLIILLSLLTVSAVSTAQSTPEVVDSVSQDGADVEELERIEELVTYGPHYKNPNAAGRLLTLNRAVPPLPADYAPVRLTGPVYKNLLPGNRPAPTTTITREEEEQLTGPRYKNRGAKTGNL
ncbi:hypothetical protein CLV84_2015 [Neolewinella xylanilytica]|uniref:Uncharacterized protein n=1 Tax=Neolewinella xylanilytica TaxID=1514080 RepID=A0A2S6I1T2_9BACT|nr:hypothetical protein [Neolewinella xylanilytica]PPK85124.1 hypothetical protein CLV84_2015 [Neolewinella xylanilytica]